MPQPEQKNEETDNTLYRLLVENVRDYAVFLLDPEGRVQTWNPAAQRLLGYRADEVIGRSSEIFYIPEDVARNVPQQEMQAALDNGVGDDDRWHVRKDGTRFWSGGAMTPLWDAAHQLRGFAKIMRDRTPWKLREAQEQLQGKLLDTVGQAVIATTPDGTIFFWNRFAETLYGWSSSEVMGRKVNEVTVPQSQQADADCIMHRIAAGEPWSGEFVVQRRDGTTFPAQVNNSPLFDEQGQLAGIVGLSSDITGRKQAEDRLRESEERFKKSDERFRMALTAARMMVWQYDSASNRLEVSENAADLFGLQPDERIEAGEHGFAVVHPDDVQRHRAEVMQAVQNCSSYLSRFRIVRRDDGAVRWVEEHGHCVRHPENGSNRLVGVLMDITAQHQAEQAKLESEQRFRQLADAMPQIVWSAKPDGEVDYVNRRWSEFTGLSQTVGDHALSQILHPEDAPGAQQQWAACVASGESFEMELRLLDCRRRSYRWHLIRTAAVYNEAGQVTRWYGTGTDIHDQKRAAETSHYLAEASATLARIVDYESTLQKIASLAVPYFADWSAVDIADQGRLRRLAVAHDDPEKSYLAQELMRRYPPDPQAESGAGAVFRTGKPEIVTEVTDEHLVQRAEDEQHLNMIRSLGLASYICVPLIVSGHSFGVLTFATAESGRRYTAEDLALANDLAHRAAVAVENMQLYQTLRDTDRRKDEFLATLAHELRNPLAPIRNSLLILKMPWVDDATVQQTRDMMERQVHQLVRLVDDLLDVSRVMRGKIELRREPVQLATIVARAVETAHPLIEVQGHELSVSVCSESLLLDADPVRLAQVVGNLLSNAAKYTQAQGRIEVSAHRENDEAVLKVRDTGIGIAPDALPHVFDLFVQVDHAATGSQGGLGIGLTLVRNLVEMHGGSVEAHSEGLGKGCEIVLRLPLISLPRQATSDSGDEQRQDMTLASGFRLLVVDDNKDAAVSLAMLLRLQGNEVRIAHDGPSALELAKSFRPVMLFLDIGMPGMDGYQVAHHIRQMPGLENVVLTALTGWGQQEDRRRTTEAGFDHHLVKPPEPNAVESVLAGLKREKR